MQKDLIQLMHNPTIKYVSGGHLSTVLKVEDYVQTIRGFLLKISEYCIYAGSTHSMYKVFERCDDTCISSSADAGAGTMMLIL